jgi:hypothetical protein
MSNVVGGIDWITAHHTGPSVANISLLIAGASFALENALANSVASGVTYTVAAGNSNLDACGFTPARAPSAITVAATGSDDSRASYSNTGPCVDVFAPGTGLTSLSNANDTDARVLSGTSMSSPVVAGIAALYLSSHPSASPAQVANVIKTTATSGRITNLDATTPNLLAYSQLGKAKVTIKKVAAVGTALTDVPTFNFSAVNLDSPTFALTGNTSHEDTNVDATSGVTTITVTEAPLSGWTLTGIGCTEVSTGLPAASDSTVNLASRTATIRAEPDEEITCTFTSQQLAPTAAGVTVSGRVMTAQGFGIRGASVTFRNVRTGASRVVLSNAFGFYSIQDVAVGEPYIVSVAAAGRLQFIDQARPIILTDTMSNLDFIGTIR